MVDLENYATIHSFQVVWVEPHALITQLAADDARRRGITIRKET